MLRCSRNVIKQLLADDACRLNLRQVAGLRQCMRGPHALHDNSVSIAATCCRTNYMRGTVSSVVLTAMGPSSLLKDLSGRSRAILAVKRTIVSKLLDLADDKTV